MADNKVELKLEHIGYTTVKGSKVLEYVDSVQKSGHLVAIDSFEEEDYIDDMDQIIDDEFYTITLFKLRQ